MAFNKNALARYKILDSCFRNVGRKYFIEDLINACNQALGGLKSDYNGISRRQIFDDIAFMESSGGWSIELCRSKIGRRVFYRYVDTKFSINNMPLNAIEVEQLQSAIDVISQFNGMPQFTWVNEMIPKLKQGLYLHKEPTVLIDFDSNLYLKGLEHLGLLYNSIYLKKALTIIYQPFGYDQPYEIKFHPYFLKQYNNRWFLFGLNFELGRYDWNLAIDRIVDITDSTQVFIENTVINWPEYFEDIIGVTKPTNGPLEEVTLHFFGKSGNYVLSKPLHGSQKSKWIDNQTLEVKLNLIINNEFERILLSFSDQVKILTPKHFVNKISIMLANASKYYL